MTTAGSTIRAAHAANDLLPARWLAWSWRCAVTTGLLVLAAVAGLLLLRQGAGVRLVPLSVGPALLASLFAAALVVAVRCAWIDQFAKRAPLAFAAVWWLSGGALLLFGAAITVPGMSLAASLTVWGVIVLEEAASVAWLWRQRSGTAPRREETFEPAASPRPSEPVPKQATTLQPSNSNDLPSDVTQQTIRRVDARGVETIEALVRANFAPQQRSLTLHLAFCPPFDRQPKVELTPIDGPELRIQEIYAQPFGVRIELRLEQPAAGEVSATLRVVATSRENGRG